MLLILKLSAMQQRLAALYKDDVVQPLVICIQSEDAAASLCNNIIWSDYDMIFFFF